MAIPVPPETLKVIQVIHDTTVVRDTLIRLAEPASGPATSSWTIPAITGAAALAAGLSAQWFRVWLDHKIRKRHLIEQLLKDLETIIELLRTLEKERSEQGSVQMQHLSQVDFLLQSYQSYEGQLTVFGWGIRNRAHAFFRELTGVRATLREIDERNLRARAGHGVSVPNDEVESTFATFPWLRGLAREALAPVAVEFDEEFRFESWWANTPWGLNQEMRRIGKEREVAEALTLREKDQR